MGNNPTDVINLARTQLGYQESRSGGHWNNDQKYSDEVPGMKWSDGQAWCATFVSWLMWKAGVDGVIYSASVAAFRDYYKREGRFSEYPAVGAVAIYGIAGTVHTGIVESYDADNITAIEGNTNISGSAEGDGVYRKVRRRRDSYVFGYGYPKYSTPLQSADPAFNGRMLGTAGGAVAQPVSNPVPAQSGQQVSIAHLKAARYADPPKPGTPVGQYGDEVRILETALAKTQWIRWSDVDGHYGSNTVGDGSQGYGGVTGFQRKHMGAPYDGWLGRQGLTKLFQLAGMDVQVVA